MVKLINIFFNELNLLIGNFYNRIYVVGFTETISEADETEC